MAPILTGGGDTVVPDDGPPSTSSSSTPSDSQLLELLRQTLQGLQRLHESGQLAGLETRFRSILEEIGGVFGVGVRDWLLRNFTFFFGVYVVCLVLSWLNRHAQRVWRAVRNDHPTLYENLCYYVLRMTSVLLMRRPDLDRAFNEGHDRSGVHARAAAAAGGEEATALLANVSAVPVAEANAPAVASPEFVDHPAPAGADAHAANANARVSPVEPDLAASTGKSINDLNRVSLFSFQPPADDRDRALREAPGISADQEIESAGTSCDLFDPGCAGRVVESFGTSRDLLVQRDANGAVLSFSNSHGNMTVHRSPSGVSVRPQFGGGLPPAISSAEYYCPPGASPRAPGHPVRVLPSLPTGAVPRRPVIPQPSGGLYPQLSDNDSMPPGFLISGHGHLARPQGKLPVHLYFDVVLLVSLPGDSSVIVSGGGDPRHSKHVGWADSTGRFQSGLLHSIPKGMSAGDSRAVSAASSSTPRPPVPKPKPQVKLTQLVASSSPLLGRRVLVPSGQPDPLSDFEDTISVNSQSDPGGASAPALPENGLFVTQAVARAAAPSAPVFERGSQLPYAHPMTAFDDPRPILRSFSTGRFDT